MARWPEPPPVPEHYMRDELEKLATNTPKDFWWLVEGSPAHKGWLTWGSLQPDEPAEWAAQLVTCPHAAVCSTAQGRQLVFALVEQGSFHFQLEMLQRLPPVSQWHWQDAVVRRLWDSPHEMIRALADSKWPHSTIDR